MNCVVVVAVSVVIVVDAFSLLGAYGILRDYILYSNISLLRVLGWVE
jgi:hypothetical protein